MNQRSKRRAIFKFVFASMGLVLGAMPLGAQTRANDFSLGLGGGFARGSTSPFNSTNFGYYVLSTLEFPSPLRAFRPRADLLFADWGEHVTALTANVIVNPITGRRVSPYLLAGAGAYSMPGSAIKPGWTLGAGLRLPGDLRAITIESRVHAFLRGSQQNLPASGTDSRWRYVWAPIGLGIQF